MAGPATFTLRRGVEELLENALANAASGTNIAVLPTELMGARIAIESIITGGPTAVTIPILASLDGVNFVPLTGAASALVQLTATGGEVQVIVAQGVKAIKIGTITLTAGASPTATIKIRAN